MSVSKEYLIALVYLRPINEYFLLLGPRRVTFSLELNPYVVRFKQAKYLRQS